MDKIQLLQERKARIVQAGKEIREDIAKIIDEDSFVELSAFSFSKNDFYGEEVAGEGVVTGFATVDGNPIYVVGQNFSVQGGGLSEANCAKIVKCIDFNPYFIYIEYSWRTSRRGDPCIRRTW